ncbi:MAG: class I SAM-dependent methyltransferase [Bacteroidia bacterium]
MEKLSACPACNATRFKPLMVCTDYTVSGSSFEIHKCEACGLEFTNPRPDAEGIVAYYKSDTYVSHTDDAAPGLINRIYRLVRGFTLAQKVKLIGRYQKAGRLLDIGCGTGAFAASMQAAGWEVQAVEPDPDAAALARAKYQLHVHPEAWLAESDAEFDVISMWHVLEHVHLLQERMEQLFVRLAKGGLLVIAVPNPESYDAAHYGTYWAARDLPRHLYHFPPKMLRNRFEQAGFKPINTKIMHFDPFYISLLSEQYKHGEQRLIAGFLKGFWFWFRSLWVNDKGSSQIYIFRKP